MPDAVFVGFEYGGFFTTTVSEPLIAFKTVDEANKWKYEAPNRDFKLVELH